MENNGRDCYRNLRSQTGSLTLYYSGRERCLPNHFFGPAVRSQYLFHYVLSGKGTFQTPEKNYSVQEGQGFLICPGQLTFYKADCSDPWDYCWFGFDGTDAEQILFDCGLSARTPIFTDQTGKLKDSVLELLALFVSAPQEKYAVLAEFYRIFSLMALPDRNRKQGEQDYVAQAVDYIRHNYSYPLRVEDLAARTGLDRTYLYKLFIKHTGQSPQQYLIGQRLTAAARLLQDTKLTSAEIACSCGFRDAPSFCRSFRKHYGKSPTEYRKDALRIC